MAMVSVDESSLQEAKRTYGHLPSLRASPPFDWYQVILLGEEAYRSK